jgi:hypothetical protein
MADPDETYEKIVTADLQRAIDFLRFAEAKNAALVALASSWFIAGLNLECSGKTIPSAFMYCVPIAMILVLLAGAVSLFSFFPRLKLTAFLGGDIRDIPINALGAELRKRYYPDSTGAVPEYIADLTVQLSVNSNIAMRKMRLFSIGVGFISAATLSLLVPAVILALKAIRALC